MKRLHQTNVNTSEYFDRVWLTPDVHRYDVARLNAICGHFKSGDWVVELGAGVFGAVQFAVAELKMQLNAYIVDFSTVALSMAQSYAPSLKAYNQDACHTLFEDEVFDVVVAGELIEHMEDPKHLVKEMARICDVDGYMVISTVVPDCPAALAHGDYPEHLWEFTIEELKDLFALYGRVFYKRVGDYHVVECKKSDIS